MLSIYNTHKKGLFPERENFLHGIISGALIIMTVNRIAQRQMQDQLLEKRIEKVKRQIFNI